MKKLLMIAYYFPPLGGAGVQRTLKFAKYLPEFGWQPVILTGSSPKPRIQDRSLLAELQADVQVHRTSELQLPPKLPWRVRHWITTRLLIIDEQIGWVPFAVSRAKSLLAKGDISAIYTTSSPYTSHLIGLRLKKLANLSWIADFRDPWADNALNHYPTAFHRSLNYKLERQIALTADRLVVVSEPMRASFLMRYPELAQDLVVTIPNGFDAEDFANTTPIEFLKSRMNIVYTGSFYSEGRSPKSLLAAIRAAFESGLVPPGSIHLYLVGSPGRPVTDLVAASGLANCITLTGYLPHRESISHLLEADLLTLIIGHSPRSEVVFTGKIFEYLAARRPVLALVPPGAAADLIREANAGWVIDPEDVPAITDRMVQCYRSWEQGRLAIESRSEVIARFERKHLTGKLAELLDQPTEGG